MAINVQCDVCKKELEEPGALAFSPPGEISSSLSDRVQKFHICVGCWKSLIRDFFK